MGDDLKPAVSARSWSAALRSPGARATTDPSRSTTAASSRTTGTAGRHRRRRTSCGCAGWI